MFNDYVVAIGTSAGGITALQGLISQLPHDFSATILVVMHLNPYVVSRLPNIIQKYSKIPVICPESDQPLKKNHIFVARPNLHMIIENDKIKIQYGPKINNSRPAIDPLFYSVASYGQKAIGIILSGLLDDGSAGLLAIKKNQGIAIAQDLEEAEYPDMPRNASLNVHLDYQLPTSKIAEVLKKIVEKKELIKNRHVNSNSMKYKNLLENPGIKELNKIGIPSVYACPECHGVLWELHNKELVQYTCHVGHTFGINSLENSINQATEEALWAALRALEEKEQLATELAEKAKEEDKETSEFFTERANLAQKHIRTIYKILKNEV